MRQSITKTLGITCLLAAIAPIPARAGAVAVLAALDSELGALKKEVELVGQPMEFGGRPVYQARFENRPVLLAKTGANPDAVAPLIRWLVNDRNIAAVISIGPAGALSDRVEIGEVVVAERAVRDEAAASRSVWTLAQVTNCESKPAGTIVTVDSFVAGTGERTRLLTAFGADVVDMSAAVIAEACTARQVPCVIIRQITDRADQDAPQSFTGAVRTKPRLTVAAALCALGQLRGGLASKGPS